MKKEIRSFKFETSLDGDKRSIIGYAAVFNSLSEKIAGFQEKIEPGAFTEAIKRSDPLALIEHRQDKVLGRLSAGTLRISEDKKGLKTEIDLPDTSYARDLVVSMERGDIKGMSFGFTVAKDRWTGFDTGHPVRTLVEIKEIFDVSPVASPAYVDATAAARSLEKARSASATTGDGDATVPGNSDKPKDIMVFWQDQRNRMEV